ncbi:MAG: hypothetical protein Q9M89_03405 [Persephonella sp.]|nr:hypothetical protein [Persephonella sp.]
MGIAKLWQEERKKLINRADQIIHHLQDYSRASEEKVKPDIEHMLYKKTERHF